MAGNNREYPTFSDQNPYDVYEQFSDSPEGRALHQRVRFASFQGEISNEDWVGLLGADVNNCEHMRLSIGLTRWFIAEHNSANPMNNQFNPHEQKLLCLAAAIHDQAEYVVGDIPNPQKTADNEEKEMRILKTMIDDRYSRDPFLCPILYEAIGTVLTNKTTKLGKAFSAIEYMGYMRTAINAWKKHTMTDDPMKKSHLERLAKEVAHSDLDRLREKKDAFPAVQKFLTIHNDCICEILQ